ncbi:MAG: hypothetical protein M0C28_16475 [Candidatus Moduliflexus flocculans]|nr:hypothetical protein [Candidatus Moduliflexus flocculans]
MARLAALKREGGKPWVVVVDAGAIYDPMARCARRPPGFRPSGPPTAPCGC